MKTTVVSVVSRVRFFTNETWFISSQHRHWEHWGLIGGGVGVQSGGGADADGCVSSKRRIQNHSVSVTTNYVSGWVGRVGFWCNLGFALPRQRASSCIMDVHWNSAPATRWRVGGPYRVWTYTCWLHVENMCDFIDVSVSLCWSDWRVLQFAEIHVTTKTDPHSPAAVQVPLVVLSYFGVHGLEAKQQTRQSLYVELWRITGFSKNSKVF